MKHVFGDGRQMVRHRRPDRADVSEIVASGQEAAERLFRLREPFVPA